MNEEPDKLGWTRKIRIARRLRAETAVLLKRIAVELHMGTWTHVANRLQQANRDAEPEDQNELKLL